MTNHQKSSYCHLRFTSSLLGTVDGYVTWVVTTKTGYHKLMLQMLMIQCLRLPGLRARFENMREQIHKFLVKERALPLMWVLQQPTHMLVRKPIKVLRPFLGTSGWRHL